MKNTDARGVLTLAWNVAAARERVVRACLDPAQNLTRDALDVALDDERRATDELIARVYELVDA